MSIRKGILFYFAKGSGNIAIKKGVYIRCENCGKEVYKTQSQFKKAEHHFCCTPCQKQYSAKILYEDRPCEVCGKKIHLLKSSSQRFCSSQCQKQWQKTRVGINNVKFTSIKDNCEVCGNVIYVPPYKYKKFKHRFCSDECRRLWYKKDFSQQESWKETSRQRCLRCLSDGTFGNITKPQLMTNEFLKELKIDFQNEVSFQYYSVDNYLIKKGLIIEVQGDFWHSNPMMFSKESLRITQKECIRRDKARETFFRKNRNIPILYLWETDIYNSPELCKQLIQEYVDKNGHLPNYNSFNFELVNGELCLKKQIIYPYYELS